MLDLHRVRREVHIDRGSSSGRGTNSLREFRVKRRAIGLVTAPRRRQRRKPSRHTRPVGQLLRKKTATALLARPRSSSGTVGTGDLVKIGFVSKRRGVRTNAARSIAGRQSRETRLFHFCLPRMRMPAEGAKLQFRHTRCHRQFHRLSSWRWTAHGIVSARFPTSQIIGSPRKSISTDLAVETIL